MKTVASVAALLLMAGSASADFVVPQANITAQPIGSSVYGERAVVNYTSIPGPYVSITGGLNSLASDDFVSTLGAQTDLTSVRFVGGITDITPGNNVLRIRLLDTSAVQIANFTVALPQAGNFIWTINLGGSGQQSPVAGTWEMSSATATTTMNWFNTSTAPAIGSNTPTTAGTYSTFEISTPTPASLALLGMGGIIAGRRRRTA